jgi:hypothetical protein
MVLMLNFILFPGRYTALFFVVHIVKIVLPKSYHSKQSFHMHFSYLLVYYVKVCKMF